jgi:glycine betaine transporter
MTVEFRRILVPTDFSPTSDLALEHAKALTTKFGGVLEVLHVVSPQIEEAGVRIASDRLARCLTREERDRYGATLTLLIGSPALTIVDHAASCKADLIVMGTHGRTGVTHMLLGSVAERVVRMARCPVLVVRGEALSTANAFHHEAAMRD